MPSASFAHRALAAAPPTRVWDSLQLPATWQSIGGVDRVYDPVIDADGALRGFSFETVVAGKPRSGVAKPHGREEPKLIAWRVESSEVRGVTTVELAPDGSGTVVTVVTVTLEVASTGVLSAVVFPVIAGAIRSGLPEAVEAFAADF